MKLWKQRRLSIQKRRENTAEVRELVFIERLLHARHVIYLVSFKPHKNLVMCV